MTGIDEKSTTCPEPMEKKKNKQKHDNSEKNIMKEPRCSNNKNKMKKKHKKKANATEDACEITEVVPKKKKNNNVALDEDVASRGPKTNGDFPKKKSNLDKDISSNDPTSAEGTHKNKKKKLVLGSPTCDPQTNKAPKKKKKKIDAEDAALCELKSIDPAHKKKVKNVVLDNEIFVAKKKRKKSKQAENNDEDEAPGTGNIVTEVIQKKKKVFELGEVSGSLVENQPGMSDQAKVKKKKEKATSVNIDDEVIEDRNVHYGEEGGDSLKVSKKKKEVSELEEETGSAMEDQPKVSHQAKVKKKKDSAGKTEDEVIADHDVHHGKEDGDSLKVSKKKKKSKGSNVDEESVHREYNLNGNRVKDSDITSEGAKKKKKKGNKAKEITEFGDGRDESLQVTYEENNKPKKKKKKRKKQEMLMHTGEEHCANEDTTEVPKKKKKKNKKTKNPEEVKKKQEENIDVQLVSERDGNSDEEHIDTTKQKSLQQDTDRKSGDTKGTRFGQWDTATFQNTEQQTKFFRLLGGFKKGNKATLTSTSSQLKANMALKKEGERVLERNLLAEFDKAVSCKQNRGVGLGFQPAQKIFFFDKTPSRSVKFED